MHVHYLKSALILQGFADITKSILAVVALLDLQPPTPSWTNQRKETQGACGRLRIATIEAILRLVSWLLGVNVSYLSCRKASEYHH